MGRPLTGIFVIGLLGMVIMTGMGSFFVGKVGGASEITDLRRELAVVFSAHMESAVGLSVSVVRQEEQNGLRVAFVPDRRLARKERDLRRAVDRMANFVLDRSPPGSVAFVTFQFERKPGRLLDWRYDRTDDQP